MEPAEDTFQAQYERVAPALYSWAALTVGPALRARLDPQDLVQEASARAFERFGDYDPALGSFRAWIFRIAKNCRNEALRGAARAGGPGEVRASQCPESITGVSRRLARDEALQHLIALVDELDPVDRELFSRCGLQGEPTVKAAVRMGLGEAAAQKRWVRLRARLRDRPWVRELLDPV